MKNNISEADWKVRVDLAAMFRLTNMMGWDDTVWNHITAVIWFHTVSSQPIMFVNLNMAARSTLTFQSASLILFFIVPPLKKLIYYFVLKV